MLYAIRLYLLVAAAVALAAPTALAQGSAVDLTTWIEESPSSHGTWTVSADSSSVFQSINGSPTFFVSPNDFFNTTVTGTFGVETTGDDDYIGFVFGYQAPSGGTADPDPDTGWDFLLFDWKQASQSGGLEGFRLLDVDCTWNTTGCAAAQFFNNGSFGSGVDVLATNASTTFGWEDNQTYTFELLYTADSVRVDIAGGTGDLAGGLTVFAIDAADAGLASFPSGRFGFYNYSQSSVRYSGFAQNSPPVAVDDDVVATPGMAETFNVLDDDSDPDGDALTISSFTSPSGGALVQAGDSSFAYTPSPGTMSDSFTYTITDGSLTATATVTITVDMLPPPPTGDITGSIAAGNCSFPRPSPTSRCFPQLTGTNGLDTAQRYTIFLRIEGTGGGAVGTNRVTSRGEIKLGPGGSASNKLSFRTKRSDPDGQYDLVMLAEVGSASSPSGAAVELDRFAFTKGGGAGLRALPAEAALTLRGANPSDGRTALELALPADEQVTVLVYDALGRRVAELFGGAVEAGYTEMAVDLTRLPAGAYVVRAQGETFAKTLRLTVVR